MKLFAIFVTCLTVTATFAIVHAHAGDTTDCKNIVQAQDAKNAGAKDAPPAKDAPAPVVQKAK